MWPAPGSILELAFSPGRNHRCSRDEVSLQLQTLMPELSQASPAGAEISTGQATAAAWVTRKSRRRLSFFLSSAPLLILHRISRGAVSSLRSEAARIPVSRGARSRRWVRIAATLLRIRQELRIAVLPCSRGRCQRHRRAIRAVVGWLTKSAPCLCRPRDPACGVGVRPHPP